MNAAAQTVILVAAVLTALGAILSGAVKIFRAVDKIEDTWTVLSEIAVQFKPNSGSSLHDRITSLEESTEQIQKDLESVLTTMPPRRWSPDDISGTPI